VLAWEVAARRAVAAGRVEGHAAISRPDARSGRPVLRAEMPRVGNQAVRGSGEAGSGRGVFKAAKLVPGRGELEDPRLLVGRECLARFVG
jgi:hypothetical protein